MSLNEKNKVLEIGILFRFLDFMFFLQKLLGEYGEWLRSNNAREVKFYEESFEKRWASFMKSGNRYLFETRKLVESKNEFSIQQLDDFSAAAASKLFEQEIREVVSFLL